METSTKDKTVCVKTYLTQPGKAKYSIFFEWLSRLELIGARVYFFCKFFLFVFKILFTKKLFLK